jgi:hypothetical protein
MPVTRDTRLSLVNPLYFCCGWTITDLFTCFSEIYQFIRNTSLLSQLHLGAAEFLTLSVIIIWNDGTARCHSGGFPKSPLYPVIRQIQEHKFPPPIISCIFPVSKWRWKLRSGCWARRAAGVSAALVARSGKSTMRGTCNAFAFLPRQLGNSHIVHWTIIFAPGSQL